MREDKDGGFEDKEYSFKLELAKEPFAADFQWLFPDPIVQRLGHCPFTAVTRVRIPLGSPKTKFLVIFASAKNSNAVRAERSETDCDAGAARRVEAKPKSIPLGSPNPNQDLEPYFFHSRGAISTVERSGVTSGANPGGNFYPNIKNPVMPPAANKTIAAAIAIATFASEIFEAGGGAEFQLKESSWLG